MCTVLSYIDANGNAYTGRTNEYPGMQPDELTYYPAGTLIQSQTPLGRPGVSFRTKYAIFGATLKGMVANARQDTLHEAMNDQGLSITANAFTENGEAKVTAPDDCVLSAADFGTWALGNFKNVREVKEAVQNKVVDIWLPRVPSMWNLITPVHYALFDQSGEGIVVEFPDGVPTVYDNEVGVLTNDPPFPWHLKNMNNYAGLTNIDKNSGQFNRLVVKSPDSGSALASLPSINISAGRFVKAAFYSNFAAKAKDSKEAIQTLSHIMNNFDRPQNITIDEAGSTGKGESVATQGATSEVTYFTVLTDLTQRHFYIRTIKSINYTRFDITDLSQLQSTKVISFEQLNLNECLDGTKMFLNN